MVLVPEHVGPLGSPFHRPLGGRVEFGEHAADAVCRELQEEIGRHLTGIHLLGVLEDIFQRDGAGTVRRFFIFAASLADKAAYEIAQQRILDDADIPYPSDLASSWCD